MKKNNILALIAPVIFVITTVLTTGCSEKVQEVKKVEVRPVKTIVVEAPDAGGIRYFPARVDANKKAEIAFRVSGKVAKLLVKEGDRVKKGDLIATLDPTEFQLKVNNKKALFTRAGKDYKRGKELVEEGNISRVDFDRIEANYQTSQSDFKLAKQQLAYTKLKAPFDGTIARRHIQSFEEIQSKQSIVTLNDNQILEVKFDIPERLLLGLKIKEQAEGRKLEDDIPVSASFQGGSNKQYPLKFKEISTKADAKTQTFNVTYIMPKPVGIIVLPGMSASVRVDITSFKNKDTAFYLPVTAVVANADLNATVWEVDEKSMMVHPVPVKVADMKGQLIRIVDGLTAGQRVVITGVPFLYEGLKVSFMKQSEQATDNLKHPSPVMQESKTTNTDEG